MTMALIDSANDRTEEGQEQISQALYDMGKHKPALVLSSCYSYLKKHTKVELMETCSVITCMSLTHVEIKFKVYSVFQSY